MKNKILLFFYIAIGLVITSCNKDNVYNDPENYLVQRWDFPVVALNETTVTPGHSDSGTAQILLMSDNSLRYDIKMFNLVSGDAYTGAHLRAGNPVSNGPVVLDLNPRISGSYLEGEIKNVRQSLIDSLLNNKNDLFFDVSSSRVPAGVARGQLNTTLVFSANINLLGKNEVPPVTTTTTGVANLRLTSDMVLYTMVSVNNVEPNDVMNAAHIHKGATGVNGPIIVPLVASPNEFGITKKFILDQATYNTILKDSIYVNAHSVLYPGGKIRGQIR